MAVASSCREVSCQVRQRSRPTSIVAAEEILRGARLWRLPPIRRRKEWATAGQYAPNSPGHTRAAMAGTMSFRLREEEAIPKPCLSWD